MIYFIIFFTLFVILCINLIEKKLDEITLSNQNITVTLPEHFMNNFKKNSGNDENDKGGANDGNDRNDKGNGNDGNDENDKKLNNFIIEFDDTIKDKSICFINHQHDVCIHGKMNHPDPTAMSPIDKRYFKFNYQKNFTTQDYINWLYLFIDNEDLLPYVHMKNLNKIKDGVKIKNIPDKGVPVIDNMTDYYKNIYGDSGIEENKGNVSALFQNDNFNAYNYNQYPTIK